MGHARQTRRHYVSDDTDGFTFLVQK